MPISEARFITWISGVVLSISLMLGLVGCADKPQPLVYVDLSLVRAEAAVGPVRPAVLARQPAFGGAEELPALPASSLFMGTAEVSLARAKEIREKNKERALREVESRLFEAAKADARREADNLKAALDPEHHKSLDQVYEDARAIFERYATPAGWYRLQLTSVVGFPDPDPKSRKLPDSTDKVALRRFEKAKDLRDTLTTLSGMFWDDFNRSLSTVNTDFETRRSQIDVQLVQKEDQLLQEARRQARDIVDQDQGAPEATGLGISAELPAQPAITTAVQAPQAAPQVLSPSLDDWRPTRYRQLENELSIWLAGQGYRLSKDPRMGRDATKEFIVWRKGFRAGL